MLSVAPFEHYSFAPDAGASSLTYKLLLHANHSEDAQQKRARQKAIDDDHAFGPDPFNWMPDPHIILKRPNLQPNATYHVSAIASERRADAIMRAMSRSDAGATDTSPAPKSKTAAQNKGQSGTTMLAVYIAALIPSNRPNTPYGSGFGGRRHLKFELEP